MRASDGLVALNSVIELMRDLDRSRWDMWEVAVWEDALAVDARELYLTFQVHNEAIVVPENIDCIRALTGIEPDGARSMEETNAALGITKSFLPKTTQPIDHLAGATVDHPEIEAVRATHAGRVLDNLVDEENIVHIDALPLYNKYTDLFDMEDVPETERDETARQVADQLLPILQGF